MAENCQYCGGRLKKLHPAHETFCIERPKTAKEVLRVRGVVRELFPAAVINPEDATNTRRDQPEICDINPEDATDFVAHPRLTQAQKRARQRAAKGGPGGG